MIIVKRQLINTCAEEEGCNNIIKHAVTVSSIYSVGVCVCVLIFPLRAIRKNPKQNNSNHKCKVDTVMDHVYCRERDAFLCFIEG